MRKLRIKVNPNARRCSLKETVDGYWLASVKAPPVDGKANAALIDLVSGYFGIRKSQVSIKTGAGSKTKLVIIND